MKKRLLLSVLLAVLCCLSAAAGGFDAKANTLPSEPLKKEDEAAVMSVVNQLFAAMTARQEEALGNLFLPEGRLVSTQMRQGKPTTRVLTRDEFAQLVMNAKEPFRERMFKPEVRIEGDVATVWGRYDFHVGERLTNCGINSFQLLRTPDGWKIIHIVSTILTTGCQETK